ncbi:hypothetical protein JTB14_004525 [Gonioctena quinquepunctata]|nr:hypothetical protein JTB14_004525 [Gonioctena quinquepunctata]
MNPWVRRTFKSNCDTIELRKYCSILENGILIGITVEVNDPNMLSEISVPTTTATPTADDNHNEIIEHPERLREKGPPKKTPSEFEKVFTNSLSMHSPPVALTTSGSANETSQELAGAEAAAGQDSEDEDANGVFQRDEKKGPPSGLSSDIIIYSSKNIQRPVVAAKEKRTKQ